jgi:hypothetical protein
MCDIIHRAIATVASGYVSSIESQHSQILTSLVDSIVQFLAENRIVGRRLVVKVRNRISAHNGPVSDFYLAFFAGAYLCNRMTDKDIKRLGNVKWKTGVGTFSVLYNNETNCLGFEIEMHNDKHTDLYVNKCVQ